MCSLSRSKMICSIFGSWESSGGYTKVNEILNYPSDPLTIQASNDIAITFDNEQKVGKHSGRIREGSKQSVSIITTVAVIQPSPLTSHQLISFKRKDLDFSETIKRVEIMEQKYLNLMCIYRHNFVKEMICDVYKEQFQNEDNFVIDSVDLSVMNEGQFVDNLYVDRSKLFFEICPTCNFNTSFFPHGFDKYL